MFQDLSCSCMVLDLKHAPCAVARNRHGEAVQAPRAGTPATACLNTRTFMFQDLSCVCMLHDLERACCRT